MLCGTGAGSGSYPTILQVNFLQQTEVIKTIGPILGAGAPGAAPRNGSDSNKMMRIRLRRPDFNSLKQFKYLYCITVG
jgi:hypothetical protein